MKTIQFLTNLNVGGVATTSKFWLLLFFIFPQSLDILSRVPTVIFSEHLNEVIMKARHMKQVLMLVTHRILSYEKKLFRLQVLVLVVVEMTTRTTLIIPRKFCMFHGIQIPILLR